MKNISHYLLYTLLIATVHLHAADKQLCLPSLKGNLKKARESIGRGAEVDVDIIYARDYFGCSLLHYAAKSGYVDVVQGLLNRGVDVNVRNILASTPLHYAAENGHVDVVRELLSRGADVGACTDGEETPLHYAARYGRSEVVKALFESSVAGVAAGKKNDDGETPADLAQLLGHQEIAQYIRDQEFAQYIRDYDILDTELE